MNCEVALTRLWKEEVRKSAGRAPIGWWYARGRKGHWRMSRMKVCFGLLIVAAIIVAAMAFLFCRKPAGRLPVGFSTAEENVVDAPVAQSRPADAVPILPVEESQEELFEDLELAGLSEDVTDEVHLEATLLARNPIHPGRAALQEQMRQETAEESFLHLTDNDNFKMLAPLMASLPLSPGCYASDCRIVRKMTRIRKLLAEAQKDPQGVSSFLQGQLKAISETFPDAHSQFMKMLREKKPGQRVTLTQLPEAQKQRLLSTAAVYVLSEIGAYDSLPLLAELSTQGKPDRSANFAGSCQVNPTFLLYGMHRLVRGFPEAELSSEARQARATYLAMADEAGLSEPETITVTAWDALYHEGDFRKTLPGQQFIFPKGQPTIEMTRFPSLQELSRSAIQVLLGEQRKFVRQAFPNSD